MVDKKVSKSKKLHKYENVYKKYVKEQQKTLLKESKKSLRKSPKKLPKKEVKKLPKKEVKKSPKKEVKKSPKKELNKYQLFVQNENTKAKYKGLCPKERMNIISKEWSKNKNCL